MKFQTKYVASVELGPSVTFQSNDNTNSNPHANTIVDWKKSNDYFVLLKKIPSYKFLT